LATDMLAGQSRAL